MERCVRAVYYEYKYYLLPDGVTLSDIISNGACTLTRLKEELCMAPDFVYESMEEENVEFTAPEHAFEVTVNLYTREEYDEILLKQVRRVCPGCERYSTDGPDDTSLDGHHREISLTGTCFEREEKDEPATFLYKVRWFWWQVSLMAAELGECIDKGNQKKLNKLINDKLTKISYAFRWYGTVHDGKYCLCISIDRRLPYAYNNIIGYFAAVASQKDNEMSEAGWIVMPCFKKGVFKYDGKKSFDDNSPALYLEHSEFPFLYSVRVYTPNSDKLNDKKCIALLSEVRDRICEALGEDVELAIVNGYELGAEKDKAESLDEIVEKLTAAFDERYSQTDDDSDSDGGIEPFPHQSCFSTDAKLNENDYLPYRHCMTSGATRAFDIALCPLDDLRENMWWTDFFTFAYLVFPEEVTMSLGDALAWYMSNFTRVPEPIGNPHDNEIRGLVIGGGAGNGYYFIDNILFDEKAFLRKIHILAPLFEGKDIKLVTLGANGLKEYKCGFDMTLLKNEKFQ